MTHASHNGAAGRYPKAMLGRVMATAAFPRSLLNTRPDGLPALRADIDPKKVLADFVKSLEDFKTKYDGRFGDMQAAYDDMQKRLAAIGIAPSGDTSALPVDPDYTRIQPGSDRERRGCRPLWCGFHRRY